MGSLQHVPESYGRSCPKVRDEWKAEIA